MTIYARTAIYSGTFFSDVVSDADVKSAKVDPASVPSRLTVLWGGVHSGH